jgi:hypothetical protein
VLSLSTILGEQQETFPPPHCSWDLMIERLPGLSECSFGRNAATARANEITEMIEAFIAKGWILQQWEEIGRNFAVGCTTVDTREMIEFISPRSGMSALI